MTILSGDIKLLASKVMDDVPEGGGGPSGTVIPYGRSNRVFSDVTEVDRAGGDVSIRQLHAWVDTPNTDAYQDANLVVGLPPNDPAISITLAKCAMFDRRADIADAIENYLIQGPEWGGYLLENHVAGQRRIQLFQRPGTPTPPIGRTLVLTSSEGLPGEVRQYVRVTRVEVEKRTFTYTSGGGFTDFEADVVVCDLTDALRTDFAGSPPDRAYTRSGTKTVVRDTTVADAATFYGASSLTTAAELGDSTLKTSSIFTQLVPSARTEVIALDQRPASQRLLTLAVSPREVTIGAAPHSTRIKVGQENRGFSWVNILKPFPAPNTVVVSYMTLGVWNTLTDDGAGQLVGAGAGTVNYTNGSIAITTQALPDVDSAIIYSWGEKSAFTNRSGQADYRAPEHALKLEHTGINPGTLTATWLSGAVLRTATANAAGVLSGDATGELNAASGTLLIRPLYMPDAGAQFVFDYDWSTVTTKSATVVPDAGGYATIALDSVPAAGSVTVRWITVSDVSATGGASSGGNASGKTSGSISTTVWEPNPDYVAPIQPVAPTAPTGTPLGVPRVVSVTTAKMFPGGTRDGTGEQVYISVEPSLGADGNFVYQPPDPTGVVWSADQSDTFGYRTIGGTRYDRWGRGPLGSV